MNGRHILIAAALTFWALPALGQGLTVTLSAVPAPGQFAGTPVALQASPNGPSSGALYQFAYRRSSGPWRIVRDFSTLQTLEWVTLEEGPYELRVTARAAGESAEAVIPYQISSRGASAPVIAPTAHPLVMVYSAPACVSGWMRVRYKHLLAVNWQSSVLQACTPGKALNFYLAGMRGNSWYVAQQQVFSAGPVADGPVLPFRTRPPVGSFKTVTVTQPPQTGASIGDTTILHSYVGAPSEWFLMATDLSGAITWYYPQPFNTGLRPVPGGTFLLLIREDFFGRVIREIDVAGNVVRETNSRIVSEQLVALGHDPIGVFHHEAIRLSNGHTLVLASVERILTDTQGEGPVHVLGDMIVDLDENLQVSWAWNAFDVLDATRSALLGETCTSEGPGCPALFLGPLANDWLHANSIGYVPEDGNLIVSLRHQDWVVKIDYRNGAGTGAVIWRFGDGGDFALVPGPVSDPWPWFSHQHDAQMGRGVMLLFDNGNIRVEGPGGVGGNSRGQAFALNELARTATLVFNNDLGAYSAALGSAQRLTNGNLYFGNGFLGDQAAPLAESVEVAVDGTRKFTLQTNGFIYRSIRMKDLFRP